MADTQCSKPVLKRCIYERHITSAASPVTHIGGKEVHWRVAQRYTVPHYPMLDRWLVLNPVASAQQPDALPRDPRLAGKRLDK